MEIIIWCLFALISGILEAKYFNYRVMNNLTIPQFIHLYFVGLRAIVLYTLAVIYTGLPVLSFIIVIASFFLAKWAFENWIIHRGKNWISAAYMFFGLAILFIYIFTLELYDSLFFVIFAMLVFMFLHDGSFYVMRKYLNEKELDLREFIYGKPINSSSWLNQKGYTGVWVRVTCFIISLFVLAITIDL